MASGPLLLSYSSLLVVYIINYMKYPIVNAKFKIGDRVKLPSGELATIYDYSINNEYDYWIDDGTNTFKPYKERELEKYES